MRIVHGNVSPRRLTFQWEWIAQEMYLSMPLLEDVNTNSLLGFHFFWNSWQNFPCLSQTRQSNQLSNIKDKQGEFQPREPQNPHPLFSMPLKSGPKNHEISISVQ